MHTIKPIDEKIIISECEDKKIAISVEEHNVIGGLGSAVGEVLLKNNQKIRFIKMGIQDTYSKSGSYQNLLDFFQINAEGISKKIIENLKE
jgi:transketolase